MLTDTQKEGVRILHAQGLGVSTIATRLGLTREYVQAYVNSLLAPTPVAPVEDVVPVVDNPTDEFSTIVGTLAAEEIISDVVSSFDSTPEPSPEPAFSGFDGGDTGGGGAGGDF